MLWIMYVVSHLFWTLIENQGFLKNFTKPNMCSNGKWPLIFPLLASVWFLMSICFNKVILLPSSFSWILCNCDNKSPSSLVKALIVVDICPKNLTSSISINPVVDMVPSLKQQAKAKLTNLITSFVAGTIVKLKLLPFVLRTLRTKPRWELPTWW